VINFAGVIGCFLYRRRWDKTSFVRTGSFPTCLPAQSSQCLSGKKATLTLLSGVSFREPKGSAFEACLDRPLETDGNVLLPQ